MFKRKGQSTVEYAMIIAVVVGGLLLMQHYVRRGLSGRYKSSSDDLGEQFDPSSYSANFNVSQSSNVSQTYLNKTYKTTHRANQESTRTGNETLGAYANDTDLFGY